MKIYKIQGWVGKRSNKKNNFGLEYVFNEKLFVVDNLYTALFLFIKMKNTVQDYKQYSTHYLGYCQLFEPHIFKDGQIANWPDKDNYIENYHWEK